MPDSETPILIPISTRYYLFASVVPFVMLILVLAATVYVDSSFGSVLFFICFSTFLLFFIALHIQFLIWPRSFSLQIGPDGISERTSVKTIQLKWDEIESIEFQEIDGARKCVTYRLKNKTVQRWFSFGRFDHFHYNQYAIDQRKLLEIVTTAFNKYRPSPGKIAH